MKKMMKWTLLLGALLPMALFTSCSDEDTEEAMALSGQWQGDFGMFYEYVDGNGRIFTFDSYDTDIVFYPEYDYATHGWGKQVDWYEYGPYEYQYYRFNWSIRYGVIYLTYPDAPELNTRISDYRLSYDYFTGYFAGSSSRFQLGKIADYYNWNYYNGTYGYNDRPNWYDYYPYYVKGEKANAPAKGVGEGKVMRRGNRFSENK